MLPLDAVDGAMVHFWSIVDCRDLHLLQSVMTPSELCEAFYIITFDLSADSIPNKYLENSLESLHKFSDEFCDSLPDDAVKRMKRRSKTAITITIRIIIISVITISNGVDRAKIQYFADADTEESPHLFSDAELVCLITTITMIAIAYDLRHCHFQHRYDHHPSLCLSLSLLSNCASGQP